MSETTTDEVAAPRKILVIGAHPDDPEFGCGGTCALWASQGHEIYYVVCTSGNMGTSESEMTGDRLSSIREDEQRAAAHVIGVKKVYFLRQPDCELTPSLEFRRSIVKAIRTVRPDVVMTHDPTTVYTDTSINHPDHQAVGHATLNAIYPTARDRLNFPEHEEAGLLAHKVHEVLLWGTPEANYWVDISSSFATKVAALVHHKTQISDPVGLEARMRERHVATAANYKGDGPTQEMSESFRRILLSRG